MFIKNKKDDDIKIFYRIENQISNEENVKVFNFQFELFNIL